MRVMHISCRSSADPLPALEGGFSLLSPYRSVGLVSTSQHLHTLEALKAFLEGRGKMVEVGGQILGCQQGNALRLHVDCYLFVGSGRFHPLGLALKTDKPVFVLNPLSNAMDSVGEEEKRRWAGKRKGALAKALSSRVFGIMVSTKDGQMDMRAALRLKKRLQSSGKEAYIVAAEELSPSNVLPFAVDCWVNTACPRIAGDEYGRPVVNASELDGYLDGL
jgi:2-(3-amino-3-carboxypropyl)histidine synthase